VEHKLTSNKLIQENSDTNSIWNHNGYCMNTGIFQTCCMTKKVIEGVADY